jgi:hypothetical protein
MTRFAYFPILRWKQGEQMAARNLGASDRTQMLPLAEVQLLDAGAAQPRLEKSLKLAGAAGAPIGIDVKQAYTSAVPLHDLAKLTTRFQAAGLQVWPVIQATDASADPPGLTHFKDQPGLVLRIYPNQFPLPATLALIKETRKACGRKTLLYVVFDMGSIGPIDLAALAGMLEPYVRDVTASGEVIQVAVAGGSFPYSLSGTAIGVGTRLPRKELDVWKQLRTKGGCDAVAFGDYGVTNPEPQEALDPETMNPAAAIRYTQEREWWLLRGSGVKTKGKGGMKQYNSLCQLLVANGDYAGQDFSFGDLRYFAHAQPGTTSGNFMTWRRDATSHHLVFTVRQMLSGDV